MSNEEPTTHDFLVSLWDAIASNLLTKTLRKKSQARSFFEFFNRIWATGLLLFILGTLGIGLAAVFSNSSLSVLDLGNVLLLVVIAGLLWAFLLIVKMVNSGATLLYAEESPTRDIELVKIVCGAVIFLGMGYQFLWKSNNPEDFLAISLLGAIITSIWLIALAWFFGGISGLLKLRQESVSTDS